jgi:hypothetical protein
MNISDGMAIACVGSMIKSPTKEFHMNQLKILKAMRVAIILFVVCFALAGNLWAKDLFVSTAGSDSVTYANNDISHPWLTPQNAWNSAKAGDIVNFRAGTYNITSLINTNSTGNSGTSSAWITFQSYSGESVVIRATASMDMMLQVAKNYYRVKNLTFDCNALAARGIGIGWYDSNYAVTGFEADGVAVINWRTGDNACAFYVGSSSAAVRATSVTIKNCAITGASSASGLNQNYSGIMVFGADDFHLENNEITQVRHGIYLKHSSINYSNHGDTVKNNYIHAMHPSGGNGHASINVNTNYTTIQNNILETYIDLGEDAQTGGSVNGNYCIINHNTCQNGITLKNDGGSSYNTITNNIFTNRTIEGGSGNTWNYNMFASGAAIGANDLGSRSPVFTGGSSPSTISGFALTSSSPGKNAASDGKDIGADVTKVGINSSQPSQSDTTPPSKPGGVSVKLK